MVVPYGDPEYYRLRGAAGNASIALESGTVVKLDSYFGMHPALAPLRPLYDGGRLAFLHAVGHYGLTRSHFDAQDFMETGTPGDKTTTTGWLDRTIAQLPGSEVTQAVSFSSQLPRSFLGSEPVLVAQNVANFDIRARNWRDEAETLLRRMYDARNTDVARTARETFSAMDVLVGNPALSASPANGASYPAVSIGNSLRQAAAVIKAGLGTRCIFVNVTGSFDTHANQIAGNNLEFGRIGQALAAFAQDLGALLDDVVVMVTTEFGRTAYVNGTGGTDHGSAHCMMLLGGRVRGGRVHGSWPGLSKNQLYQDRDLAATTDFRDAFAEVARAQLGVDPSALFPGYTPGPGPGVVS
jgi:uncharacterized protein (DUF1501 family)